MHLRMQIYCFSSGGFSSGAIGITPNNCVIMFQQTVLQFLNAVIVHAPTSNLRVYYQQEIENAGFNADSVEEVFLSDVLNA